MSVLSCSLNVLRCRVGPLQRIGALAVACATTIALAAPDASAQTQGRGRVPATVNVLPTVITSVTAVGGQLVANGLVGTTPFQAPLTVTLSDAPALAQATCPVLSLSLAPIHLSLLGLNVDTSAICLDITATEGGGLLGDLLCSIGGGLAGGQTLADVLGTLDQPQLDLLNAGLTQVLNQAVVIPASSSAALQNATCDVLSLALGPIDLSLLGLNVSLDDCAGGPVTVDITATEGGGLLGDLLCSLAGGTNQGRAGERETLAILRQISALIGRLLG